MPKKKMNLSVVGLRHRLTLATMRELEDELPIAITLTREPRNQNDENAVKVVIDDPLHSRDETHLGYLIREVAATLAPEMDNGRFELLEGHLIGVDADAGTGEIVVRVAVTKAKPAKKAS